MTLFAWYRMDEQRWHVSHFPPPVGHFPVLMILLDENSSPAFMDKSKGEEIAVQLRA